MVIRRYWFGINSENSRNAAFARKLRVFIASEEMLEELETFLLRLPGSTSHRHRLRNVAAR